MADAFSDFELNIVLTNQGHWKTRVIKPVDPDGRELLVSSDPPFEKDDEDLRTAFEFGSTEQVFDDAAAAGTEAKQPESVGEEMGAKLFASLFRGNEVRDNPDLVSEVERCFRNAIDKHEVGRLRIRLRVDPALAWVPWELLFDPVAKEYLAQSSKVTLVRTVSSETHHDTLRVKQLRILAMVASPLVGKYCPLEGQVGVERTAMDQAWGAFAYPGGPVTIEWIEPATFAELKERLDSEEWHIFHFFGHGDFDGEGSLVFLDTDGGGHPVPAHDVARELAKKQSLRLVVLNACRGADESTSRVYAGVASAIANGGVPAVLARRGAVRQSDACSFSTAFYNLLAGGGKAVDEAVNEAREKRASYGTLAWAIPVLYMGAAGDNALFELPPEVIPQAVTVDRELDEIDEIGECRELDEIDAYAAPWEPCDPEAGRLLLDLLARELPMQFGGARFESARRARLVFYEDHDLVEIVIARAGAKRRCYVLEGSDTFFWLNGDSAPMHDVNERESLELDDSTVDAYLRFFMYFMRASGQAFTLVESDRAAASMSVSGVKIADERVRHLGAPLTRRGHPDEAGHWVFDATVVFGNTVSLVALTVSPDGMVTMLGDEPIFEIPRVPDLDLRSEEL